MASIEEKQTTGENSNSLIDESFKAADGGDAKPDSDECKDDMDSVGKDKSENTITLTEPEIQMESVDEELDKQKTTDKLPKTDNEEETQKTNYGELQADSETANNQSENKKMEDTSEKISDFKDKNAETESERSVTEEEAILVGKSVEDSKSLQQGLEPSNKTETVQEACKDSNASAQETEPDSETINDQVKGADLSIDESCIKDKNAVEEITKPNDINEEERNLKEVQADEAEAISNTVDAIDNTSENELSSVVESAKETVSVTGVVDDKKSAEDINGSLNNGGELMNMSTRATFGDSSCDNMSVSAVSETKSGGFERRFSVEKMEEDDSDMNTLKEERLEQYLESMKSVNQANSNVEIADNQENDADSNKLESTENENKGLSESVTDLDEQETYYKKGTQMPESQLNSENAAKETVVVCKSHENSDKSTESSNGEKSQTDMEVAQIMQKGLGREKMEQNENTSIPDVEIDPKSEKDIWRTDNEKKETSEENVSKQSKEVTGSTPNSENKSDKDLNELDLPKEAEKDTVVYPDNETDFAFVKLPVSSKAKKDAEQPREILKRKMFDEFAEDSSNSSWYKIKDKPTEEPMDTDDKTSRLLVPDEGSNLSIPDDSSLASASGMEDSRLSFTDQVSNLDESSNLSAGDSCSVKAFGHELVLDESANLNPPDKDLFVQPSTPSSVVTDATSEATPVKRYRRGTLAQAVEEASSHGHNVKAKDLFEYQWPQESGGDWFMLQEQISTYLEVKSFKRKYPDLFRRVCDKSEKDFLREKGVVSETQSDLGLTALKSEEVHELISKDYPSKYREYCTVLHEKEKQIMVSKQKDYVLPKLEKSKMREYTMKAMKSASEWNRQFLKERNEERRAYFDMQTFAIHYPKSKFRKLENIRSTPTSYPVSLIPGQFQEYCRKYTAEELKYFPLNTAMLDPPKDLVPGSEVTQVAENQEKEADKARPASDSESSSESGDSDCEDQVKKDIQEKLKETLAGRETSAEKLPEAVPFKVEELPLCWVCVEEEKQGKQKKKRKNSKTDEEFISCSECKKRGHASCLDLTDSMLKVIKTYPWQCMECKTCVECMNSTDEDKMLFCDRCDRGYHTFCVGLKSLPTGKWECVSCREDTTTTPVKPGPKPQVKAISTGKRRGRPPKTPVAEAR